MEDFLNFLRQALADETVRKFFIALAGAVVIGLVARILRKNISRHIANPDVRYRLRKFISFAGYLIGILFVLSVFSEGLRGIQVAFGIAGAGIAFSLQEVIVSIAGWIAVSFGKFYNPGDRVQLGGIKGDVIDIGILRTTLMECGTWVNADQYNGRIVRIANSFIFKEPVFNYSTDFPFLWDELTVPVKYGSDFRMAREILETVLRETVGDYVEYATAAWKEIVRKYLIEPASVEPMVTMIANDNWIEYTLRYVVDYKARRPTKDRIFTRVLEEFEKTGGKVSIASATFQLVEVPRIDVKLSGESS